MLLLEYQRLSTFKNLVKIIKKYEDRRDKESKFIHAIDKILPPIQIYLDNGKMWREKKVSLEDLLKNKNKKIALSPDIDKYWQELVKEFTKNKKIFF